MLSGNVYESRLLITELDQR